MFGYEVCVLYYYNINIYLFNIVILTFLCRNVACNHTVSVVVVLIMRLVSSIMVWWVFYTVMCELFSA